DGAMWASAFGSQGKAMASAAFGRPSGDMTARADHPTLRGIAAAEGNHMFYGQGAVPIFRQGILIGACGVGGGPPKKTRIAPAPELKSSEALRRWSTLVTCAAPPEAAALPRRSVRSDGRAARTDRRNRERRGGLPLRRSAGCFRRRVAAGRARNTVRPPFGSPSHSVD